MEYENLIALDQRSREKIISDINKNLFVEAGAGSGKTTMLVRRMVAMIEAGIDVSRICAITFTKAAAAEFYNRFHRLLTERSCLEAKPGFIPKAGELSAPTEETRRRCRKALENINLCFMGTIDSFCNMVLSEHPMKAGIPSSAAMKTEEEFAAIYLREYSDMLAGKYGEELKNAAMGFKALHGKNDTAVFKTGVSFLADIRHTERMPVEIPDISDIEKQLDAFTEMIGILAENAEEAKYGSEKNNTKAWESVTSVLYKLKNSKSRKASAEVLRALKDIAAIRVNVDWMHRNKAFNVTYSDFWDEHAPGKKSNWFELVLEPLLNSIENYIASVSIAFLDQAAAGIKNKLRGTGELDFFDYLLYIRDALKADAEADGTLIQHIYGRHSYFLIDEFQDTNPMQAEVFFYLTAQNPTGNWKKCIPKPGSLFIVGDPKQSIYRFRNADVSAYLGVKALFTAAVGETVSLTCNFRSTQTLKKWFNTMFSALMPTETKGQCRFEEIPIDPEEEAFPSFSGAFRYESKSNENITEIIQRLVHNEKITIRENGKLRQIEYSDIMLVPHSKGVIVDYMKVLREKNIPFRVEGNTDFGSCAVLHELQKIYAAAAEPGDIQKLYDALTGSVFGCPPETIGRIKEFGRTDETGGKIPFRFALFADNDRFSDEPELRPLLDALERMRELAAAAGEDTPSSLYMRIMNTFPLFMKADPANLDYVWFALELLREGEASGKIITIRDGSDYLQKLLRNNDKLERSLSLNNQTDCVRIANLHKVKGLEAPVVILASPKHKKHAPSRLVVQNDSGPQSWVFRIADPDSHMMTLIYHGFPEKEEDEAAFLADEGLRLLYVAATRAKDILLISYAGTQKDGSYSEGYWNRLLSGTTDFFASVPGNSGTLVLPEEVTLNELGKKSVTNSLAEKELRKASYHIIRPSLEKKKGKSAGDSTAAEADCSEKAGIEAWQNDSADERGRKDGALIGTMAHKVMEALVTSRNKADAELLADETAAEYAFDLSDTARKKYRDMLIKMIRALREGGYKQPAGETQDVLKMLLDAEEVHCEVPFCYKEEESDDLCSGVMDAVYRKGDTWHILDYKTNLEAKDLESKYEQQMKAYEKAFTKLTGNKATARIYHLGV